MWQTLHAWKLGLKPPRLEGNQTKWFIAPILFYRRLWVAVTGQLRCPERSRRVNCQLMNISFGRSEHGIFRYFGNLLAVKDKVLIRGCRFELQKSSCIKMVVEWCQCWSIELHCLLYSGVLYKYSVKIYPLKAHVNQNNPCRTKVGSSLSQT